MFSFLKRRFQCFHCQLLILVDQSKLAGEIYSFTERPKTLKGKHPPGMFAQV